MNVDQNRSAEIVAGVVLLRQDSSALLQLRDVKPGLRKSGMWVFPGGHCEAGESLKDCARREVWEETGYSCAGLHELITFIDDTDCGYPPHQVTFFWELFDRSQAVECKEGQKLEFVKRTDAPALAAPAYLISLWDMALAELRKLSA